MNVSNAKQDDYVKELDFSAQSVLIRIFSKIQYVLGVHFTECCFNIFYGFQIHDCLSNVKKDYYVKELDFSAQTVLIGIFSKLQ